MQPKQEKAYIHSKNEKSDFFRKQAILMQFSKMCVVPVFNPSPQNATMLPFYV